ncbi:amidohydrolase family protein [Prolixibacteraceae bacterium Z1-6]|uniref:Amidohydrolase family protein n=1 Tax=Draconibacterium aestuarii TaxID=2998507 RepID=A0A9X3FAR4_9BACT|nr:amidohydrolase family protein [Prolixibacteraceae bacterium Z1-6]
MKFILFHGAYPFGGELASLAKNFRNVYIDLCWLYIISPTYSRRYLHEWLETIPANKIIAFVVIITRPKRFADTCFLPKKLLPVF